MQANQTPNEPGKVPAAPPETPPAAPPETPPAAPLETPASVIDYGKQKGPTAPPDWLSKLSEDIRENEEITKFDSVEALAKAYVTRDKPAEIPQSPEGYQLPKDVPEYAKDFAHKAKLTQEQLLQVIAYEKAQDQFYKDKLKTEQQGKIEKLQQEWGDRFNFNSGVARNTLKRFDPERELRKFLDDSGAINEPVIAKFLYNVGQVLQEHGFLLSENVPSKGAIKKNLAETLYPNHPNA